MEVRMKRWEGIDDMAGRLTNYVEGVVTWGTGEMILGPDVREAGERIKRSLTEIDLSLEEAKRSVWRNDPRAALAWVTLAHDRVESEIKQLDRDMIELDARIAENREGLARAFPGMRIVAKRP